MEQLIDDDKDGSFLGLNRMAGRMVFWIAETLEVDPRTAIQDMSAWGHYILGWMEWIAIGILAIKIGGKLIGGRLKSLLGGKDNPEEDGGSESASGGLFSKGFGLVKSLLGFGGSTSGGFVLGLIMGILKFCIFLILIAAIFHAYILPWMPFLFHFMFVFSYLILVSTAILSAPVWAVWFVRLDDPELFGQQLKPGFMILLNLVLRPPCQYLPYFGSFAVWGITYGLNQFGKVSFLATIGIENDVGLVGATVFVVIIMFLHYTLLMNSLSLISETVDTILLWVGDRTVTTAQKDEQRSTQAIGVLSARMDQETKQIGMGAMNCKLS